MIYSTQPKSFDITCYPITPSSIMSHVLAHCNTPNLTQPKSCLYDDEPDSQHHWITQLNVTEIKNECLGAATCFISSPRVDGAGHGADIVWSLSSRAARDKRVFIILLWQGDGGVLRSEREKKKASEKLRGSKITMTEKIKMEKSERERQTEERKERDKIIQSSMKGVWKMRENDGRRVKQTVKQETT